MTPETFLSDKPAALAAYELITAAQIPPEPSFNCFADYETDNAYNAAERVFKAKQAERRVLIRDVAAEIARRWPHPTTRGGIEFDLLPLTERGQLPYRTLIDVFKAAREEAAAVQAKERVSVSEVVR